jgi:hypothetical protein
MRQVTIDGQKKRFASFELGKIEPLDVAAFQAVYNVYLKEGFTVDEVNRFVDWMNKSKYTEEQRMEIIEAVVQSVMVENYALLAQNQKPNNAREIKEFLEERAENLQSMLVALNICSAEKSIRFLMTFRSVIAAEFGEVEERLKWRNAADTAPSEPMLAVELVAGFTHRNMLGRDSSRFSSQLNQVSILHERNVPAAILTIEYMLQRISNETNTERRIRSLGELVSTFARQEKNMGDNPFFLVQYGRTALTLGKLEIVNPGSVRGNINGRRLAEFCFERAIHLLEKEQKVAVPADLKRDFGETLIALRSRVVEAVATLESVIEDVPDREGVYFSIQVGRAISKQELDVEFGRSLLADSKLRSDRPFDSCLVFAGLIRQRVEDSQVFENAIEEQIANLEGFSSEEIAEARWMLQRVKSLASPEIY